MAKATESLRDRMLKTSTIKKTTILKESPIFKARKFYDTGIPIINLALSGDVDKGLYAGVTLVAGPSKHFKTKFSLEMMAGFLRNSKNGVGLVYDNEFGSPAKYFESSNIDQERVVYTPIMNMEELKFDIIKQVEQITDEDEVFILIDSIGNVASKKELDDAMEGESKQDMTRAKMMKSIFRMLTPYTHTKNICLVAIGHTYQTQEMYSKSVVSGGCLVKGTLLKTPSGLIPIEKLIPGQFVNTLEGEKEIIHVWNPDTLEEGEPECYEIEFEDKYKIICSENHKFLINGQWIEAKNLIEGYDVEVA
jgi:hypothetical protein